MGDLKTVSAEGVITADIIKAAMFNAADDINRRFETMPRTFGDDMNLLKNSALQGKRQIAPTCQSDEGYDTLDYD
jgi:hypothetical protein